MRYYVYILLDSRYPGEYDNEYFTGVNFKPFYVGKGDRLSKNKSERHLIHYKFCKNERHLHYNPHKCNTINLLMEQNHEPNYVIVYENDDEQMVYDVEKKLIDFYGKFKDGGILTNIADGGSGGNTIDTVPGLKEKLNKIASERWSGENNPNYNRPLEETFSHQYKKVNGYHWNTGRSVSDETKQKIRKTKHEKLPYVERLDPDTLEVLEVLQTLDTIAKYGMVPSTLYRSLNHGGKAKGFYWKYQGKELVLSKSLRPDYVKPVSTKIHVPKKVYFKHDINDENEIEYKDIHEAGRIFGNSPHVIARKCNGNTKTKNIFRYDGSEYKFKLTGDGKIPILRVDKDGNQVIFNSVREAALNTDNGNPSSIVSVCKGRRMSHRGYKFEYYKK